ncbi:MAG: OmpA family protein [Hyphomonadaceae bacterium]|nr:OmpA family protein [Hyphomonadaceae bacterium]
MIKKFALGAMAALVLAAGCTTTDPYSGERTPNRTANAAIIGAIGGAAAGTLAGGDDRRNAAVGAAVGAIAGAGVGAYMDAQERKLREQMRNSGVGVTRTAENEITLNLPSDITFDVDRADIKPQFRTTLVDVARTLQEYPSTTVDVAGHADSTGPDDYNQRLSQRRADAVAQALIQNGVQPVRVVAVGFGESRPIADNATVAGRAQNRRVEIKLVGVTS